MESKRIEKFRIKLARAIPRFPNNRASLHVLESMTLDSVLIAYANWAIRYVRACPRNVRIERTASDDPRWASLSAEIGEFINKVKRGDDLTPHLSIEPHTRGFAPASGAHVGLWADKDMLLNVMGYHHFHIGMTLEPGGHAKRTKDVIFAAVTKDVFDIVAIFDHSVFEIRADPTTEMTSERTRLWGIFDARSMQGVVPGSFLMSNMIATSGHSLSMTQSAMEYARVIRKTDIKLDDRSFVASLLHQAGIPVLTRPKLQWCMRLLTLGLWEPSTKVFLILREGPN